MGEPTAPVTGSGGAGDTDLDALEQGGLSADLLAPARSVRAASDQIRAAFADDDTIQSSVADGVLRRHGRDLRASPGLAAKLWSEAQRGRTREVAEQSGDGSRTIESTESTAAARGP